MPVPPITIRLVEHVTLAIGSGSFASEYAKKHAQRQALAVLDILARCDGAELQEALGYLRGDDLPKTEADRLLPPPFEKFCI